MLFYFFLLPFRFFLILFRFYLLLFRFYLLLFHFFLLPFHFTFGCFTFSFCYFALPSAISDLPSAFPVFPLPISVSPNTQNPSGSQNHIRVTPRSSGDPVALKGNTRLPNRAQMLLNLTCHTINRGQVNPPQVLIR